ncbi:MAG: hypothetical protein IJZ67_07430 [Alistipes sp.]|nr:hypothetical protein [Alistipes sp.]
MKNIFRILMAVAVLLTASCAKEDISSSIAGGEVEVTFIASLPQLGTRAEYGAGAKVNTLRYYVYDGNEYLSELSGEEDIAVGVPTTVNLVLLKGMTYNIVFWADCDKRYVYNEATKVVTVDYVNANDEERDAFYKFVATFDPATATSEDTNIVLTRPFAQLNAAVSQSDIDAVDDSQVDLTTSTVELEAYTTLNIATGEVDGKQTVKFAEKDMPNTDFNGYTLLSMNYILVPQKDDKMVSDVEFTLNAKKSSGEFAFTGTKYFSVPLKRNYRTNILGSLLTKPTDFTVTINPVFTEPAEVVATDAFSLQEAINNAQDGKPTQITLGGDIDLSGNMGLSSTRAEEAKYGIVIPAEKDIILNLKSGAVLRQSKNQTAAYSMIQNNGTLTIKGNGTISYTDTGNGGEYVSNTILNSGTLTIDGCTIENNSSADVAKAGYPQVIDNNKKLTINSGKLDCKNYASIRIWCTTDDDTEVTIKGGTFIGSVDLQNVNGNANKGVLNIHGGEFSHSTYNDKAIRLVNFGKAIENLEINIYNAVVNGALGLGGADKSVDLAEVLTVYGGTFSTDPSAYIAQGYAVVKNEDGSWVVKEAVAKVGNTEYGNIDDAIAAWTNNTTLTLLADVALTDVVTLKSTEHHILNLGTYTMKAATSKNAIEITPYGDGAGTAARSCLTINADTTNPGSIEAGSKACIYYRKTNGINDRIMVTINGGIFNGTISSSSNNGGQACPYFVFNGGTFNKSVNLTKAMLKVTGGIFHGMFSCTGDSTAHRLIAGGTFKYWTFMTADAANKFAVGTAKSVYDVGVYVNNDGYLVVGGPVITDFGDKFAAKATNATKWSSYLKYSSAAEYGLYYTNAEMAITKHGEANVILK